MGKILHDLVRLKLPEREAHNSRMFIDLCENIHIHHREFRQVFSLNEYFEYVDILEKSTNDVRSYLAQNPDYEEHKYKTTLMVAGGRERQLKLLENSPAPNRSEYFANDFAIELQDESVVDEIHVHWRDFRFAMNRESFRTIADAFSNARKELDQYEMENLYRRRNHHDRSMDDFAKEQQKYAHYQTKIMDEETLPIEKINSRYNDIKAEFDPDKNAISLLVDLYKNKKYVFPILLSTEKDGSHSIIDGNHRYYAALEAGVENINCIITGITFADTELFRKAESLLKQFDRKTDFKYGVSGFNREFMAYKLGKYYKDHFWNILNPTAKQRTKNFMKDFKSTLGMKLEGWPRVHKVTQNLYRKIFHK